jgi:hypothetical protein
MARIKSVLSHKMFKIILALYIFIYCLIWAVSSPIAKHYIEPVLTDYGLQLSESSSIRYNPFITELHISDFMLVTQDNQEKVFAIESFKLQLRLWEVLFDDIVVEEFVLEQAYIKVVHNQGNLTIAGVALPQGAPKAPDTPTDKENPAEKLPLPYQIRLPELLISQLHIDIINNDIPHDITINTLALRDVKATEITQQGQLFIDALLDKTALSLNFDAELTNALGDISSDLTIENYPIARIQRYVEQLNELKGALSLHSKQKLTLKETGITLHIEKATVENNDLIVGLPEQNISLDNIKHTITDLIIALDNGNITQLEGAGSIVLNNFKVTKPTQDLTTEAQEIFSSEKLAIDNIIFHNDDQASIKIADILIDNLAFSTKHETSKLFDGEKLPSVMKLKQVAVSDINATANSLAIDTITLDELLGNFIIDEEKAVVNLVKLANTSVDDKSTTTETAAIEDEKTSKEADETSESAEPAFIFSLNKFQLVNKNELFFVDHSVEPTYKSDFFIDTLELNNINNSAETKDQPSPFTFKGRNNKYAKINLAGFIKPFADVPVYNMAGDFKEMSLPAISSYLKGATGLEIKTGQLNLDLDVTLTGDMIEGETELLLQGLDTAIADDDEVDSLLAQGALPLNIAMGMLKDSDGNVTLGFPLSGSIHDPKFGVSNIIAMITQKAILSATQDYLVQTFVPYANIVSLAVSAGEYALKLRFDDLPYDIAQIKPNEKQQEYLQQFISLMQDKETTRVNLCAINTPADIKLTSGEKVIDKKEKKRLIALGKERADALKDYLIEKGNIDSSRMLLCKPKIDSSEGALPRVSISV